MMMSKLLYIGNKLSVHGNTATSIETLGAFLETEGYTVFYASSKKNKILRMLDMVYKTIKYSRKVDYVLIDTYSTQNFWFAIITSQLCRFFKVKYIAKLHGGDLPNRLEKSPFFCNLIFKNAYKITVPSGYLMEAFERKKYKNLLFIPNTIEIALYPFLNREIVVPKLLWVRSFSDIYNPKMAIKVVHEVSKMFPDAQLCMVGPDKQNLIPKCKDLAKTLNVKVTFTGKLSKEDWIKLSSEYSIFINTTHFDNTPVSVIEAMALGLPIISTNVGGIPFLLNHNENALLVEDNDVKAMSDAIEMLVLSKLTANKLIVNARNEAETFDWEVVKHKWIEILK